MTAKQVHPVREIIVLIYLHIVARMLTCTSMHVEQAKQIRTHSLICKHMHMLKQGTHCVPGAQ